MKNTNSVEGEGCSSFLSQLKNCEKMTGDRNPEYLKLEAIKTQTLRQAWPAYAVERKKRSFLDQLILKEKERV